MAKKRQLTPEEIKQNSIDQDMQEIKRMLEIGSLPLNPTRIFKINERVIWGAHEEVYVREIHAGGLYYTVENILHNKEGKPTGFSNWNVITWLRLHKTDTKRDTNFTKDDDIYIRQLNSGLDSLLHLVYAAYAGVDFDSEYQRDHVWELEDKVALIDSIFNNVEIGKFIFVQRRESTPGKYMEIIDGKQRLTAICEFYEDRFQYKGKYFSELSAKDHWKFLNHNVSYGYLENPTKRKVYETFIKMNTCGKPMDKKYVDNVKNLLKQLKNEDKS